MRADRTPKLPVEVIRKAMVGPIERRPWEPRDPWEPWE